jgi:hypothetical protein
MQKPLYYNLVYLVNFFFFAPFLCKSGGNWVACGCIHQHLFQTSVANLILWSGFRLCARPFSSQAFFIHIRKEITSEAFVSALLFVHFDLPFGLLLFFGFQSLYCMRGKKKKTEQ